MKFKLAFVLLFSLACYSKSFAQTTPEQFIHHINTVYDSVTNKAIAWNIARLKITLGSKHFDKLGLYRINLLFYIKDEAEKFRGMPNVGESEKLRQAMLAYLDYHIEAARNALKSFEALNPNSTYSQINPLEGALTNAEATEKQLADRMHSIQTVYEWGNKLPVTNHAGEEAY